MVKNSLISIVDRRGKVRWINPIDFSKWEQKGARKVFDPKQNYYPEFDEELVSKSQQVFEPIQENVLLERVLQVELV